MSAAPKRLLSIDALRGIAALSVVYFHTSFVITPEHWDGAGLLGRFTHYLNIPFSFGRTGVFLFFVISGFCIHMK